MGYAFANTSIYYSASMYYSQFPTRLSLDFALVAKKSLDIRWQRLHLQPRIHIGWLRLGGYD